MAMITMSSGGGSKPRCRISQSRALISKPGTRQAIHKARVADSTTIATAQIATLSLDKIAGFPFRQKNDGRSLHRRGAENTEVSQREKERRRDSLFEACANSLLPLFSLRDLSVLRRLRR